MITGGTETTTVVEKSKIEKAIAYLFKGKNLMNIVIILIPIILIYVYMAGVSPKEIRQTLNDNKKIESKVDSIKSDNQFIVERMYELEKKQVQFFELITKNNDLIQENNKELLKLKKLYNAKINSVSNYSTSQLDSFFTSRYKEYYNNR